MFCKIAVVSFYICSMTSQLENFCFDTFKNRAFLNCVNQLERTRIELATNYNLYVQPYFGYSFILRSRNQTTNQIPRSYKNDGFDWPFDLVIVT